MVGLRALALDRIPLNKSARTRGLQARAFFFAQRTKSPWLNKLRRNPMF